MMRRDFLRAGASAALLPAGARAAVFAPDADSSFPAIDTHIHLYDPTRPQGVPWPAKTDPLLYAPHFPSTFRAVATPFNVVGAVVVEASDWIEDNQWVLDLARDNTEIVGVVGNLRPGQPDFAANLRRFAANPLFRGLRLKSGELKNLDQPAFEADLRRLSDADLSVDVLGGPAILAPAFTLARRFPQLRIVVNHLPFKEGDGNAEAMRGALAAIARQPNVFIKISDVVRRVDGRVVEDPAFYRAALDVLCEQFGPDRVLYASNWPVSDRVAPYGVVHRTVAGYFASLGRSAAEKYFWRNSFAAYRWQRRGAAAALKP